MLSLSQRPARLNQDYRGKTNEKDGEVTKLLHFGLEDIEIDQNELGSITNQPHAYRLLFDTSKAQVQPTFECFKAFVFDEEVENACVEVRLHGGSEYKFTGCTLSKIKLNTKSGKPVISCKVKTAPALDDTLAELVANFGEIIDVAIHGVQESDQKSLPLSTVGTGEQPEQGKRKPGRPRKGTEAPATH